MLTRGPVVGVGTRHDRVDDAPRHDLNDEVAACDSGVGVRQTGELVGADAAHECLAGALTLRQRPRRDQVPRLRERRVERPVRWEPVGFEERNRGIRRRAGGVNEQVPETVRHSVTLAPGSLSS